MTNRGEPAASPWCVRGVVLLGVVAMATMGGSRTTASPETWWEVAWTAGGLAAVVGTVCASLRAREENRTRWWLWSAAAIAWFVGQIACDVYAVTGTPPSPNISDFGSWGFAVLVIVSMVRVPARSRSLRAVSAVETVPLVAAAMALTFAELWPNVAASSLPLAPRLSTLAYPALYVSAAVLTVQATVGGALLNVRSAASRLVLCGVVAQALAFIFWSKELLDQTYVAGTTVIDPLWAVGMVVIGIGGAVAARRPEAAPELDEPSDRGGLLPAVMFLLLLTVMIRDGFGRSPSEVTIGLAIGVMFSGVALIARSALLQHRLRVLLQSERAALAIVAERESQLARLNERLVEDTRRDPLTGMRNRRALSDDLPQLEAINQERGEAFALALCDVDHFKPYNDRLGHLAGDQALRAIASTVRGALRAGDAAYRFGGEELLLVLRNANATDALAAAERVRAAVQKAALPHPDGIAGILTVSIGVAAGIGDSGSLLALADAALYDAKRAGRNRVIAGGSLAAGDGDHAGAVSSLRAPGVPVTVPRGHDEPVPRHLCSMLAVSRAAASGRGPLPVLEALAETIHSELSFGVVAVNVVERDPKQLRAAVVLGDDEARQALLGTVNPWSEWEPLLRPEYQRCGAIWLPAGSFSWEGGETTMWTPAATAVPGHDGWHPDDMLLLPLRGSSGEVLGFVSVDQPLSGRRPDDAELTVLMAVADHAGLALEQVQRDSAQSEAMRQESQELRLAAVMLLAETVDLRDASTARHSRTVGEFARQTAAVLGLGSERVERVYAAGVLHDLGKLGVADAILLKAGPLDDGEWREIQRHPEIGARILEHAGMDDIAAWVRAHHERVDGRGYPRALTAQQIPLEARILAVADAYEAMIADRPYRTGMAPQQAAAELRSCAGTQFDPHVVESFLTALEQAGDLAREPLKAAA